MPESNDKNLLQMQYGGVGFSNHVSTSTKLMFSNSEGSAPNRAQYDMPINIINDDCMNSSSNCSISKEQHKVEEMYMSSKSDKCAVGRVLPTVAVVEPGTATATAAATSTTATVSSGLDNTPFNFILQSISPDNELSPTQNHPHEEDKIFNERGPRQGDAALRQHRDGIYDGRRMPYSSFHKLTPLTSVKSLNLSGSVSTTRCGTKIKFKATNYMATEPLYEWLIEPDKVWKLSFEREQLDAIRQTLCSREGKVDICMVPPSKISYAPTLGEPLCEGVRKFWCSNPEFPTPQNFTLQSSSISTVTNFNKHGHFGNDKEVNTHNSESVQCVLDLDISFHNCDMSMLSNNDDDDGCRKCANRFHKGVKVRTCVTHTEAGSRTAPVIVTENETTPVIEVQFLNTHGQNINEIRDASVQVYKTQMSMKEMDHTSAATPVQTPAPAVKGLFDNAPKLAQRVHAFRIVPVSVYVPDGVLNDDEYAPVSAPVTAFVLAPVPDYKATEIVYNNTSTNTPVVEFAPIAKV